MQSESTRILLGKAMSGILLIASKAPVGFGYLRGRPDDYGTLASVWRAYAGPAVADLMVVHAGIVDSGVEAEDLRRQKADRVEHRIGRHHAVMLGSDERHARVDQRLLRVEHVQRGALAGLGFLAHTVERDLGGRNLRLRGLHLRLAGFQLAPGLHDVGAGLIACGFEIQTLLRQVLFRLAD